MKKTNLIASFLAVASLAALPTLAAADRRTNNRSQMVKLGEVDTHANDAEDFVSVPNQRFDSIVVTARGGNVPLSGLKIQYSDGKIDQPFARGTLRPGQRVVVDVPRNKPIKMLVLDYNERLSSRWGDSADAQVDIYGTVRQPQRPSRGEYGFERDHRDDRPERYQTVAPQRAEPARYEIRGGIRVRIN